MNCRVYTLALALVPLALTVGCEKKQSKEEIIAEYEASKLEQERVDKLEQELAELKAQQAEGKTTQAQQVKNDLQKALEKQIQDAKKKAEEAEKNAKEVEAGMSGRRSSTEGSSTERRKPTTITVAQGTKIVVSLSGELTTESHQTGDSWSGKLAQDVTSNGEMIWTAGTSVSGIVSQSTPTGRLANGEGALAIKLTDVGGTSIDGGIYAVTGDAKGARNAKVIGTTAALGALVGVLSNKKNQTDHALGGAAIGAAVGTAVAAGTASTVITIPSATSITFSLPADERISVRNR